MAGQNDRVALPQFVDQFTDLDHLRGVKADGGFVQDDDLRVAEQRGGQAHALAVALGQVADQAAAHAGQAGALARAGDIGGAGGSFALALELCDKIEIFLHRHVHIKRRDLGHIADAGLGGPGLLLDVMAVDNDGAARRRKVAGDHVHGGGFARAVGPEQAVDAAVLHREADVIDRHMRAVALGQVADFDQSIHSPFVVIRRSPTVKSALHYRPDL